MRVLIIKTSSMGDIIHTFPALTDAKKNHSNIIFDWVVEESFAEIPQWHPAVDNVISCAIRRWRKSPFNTLHSGEWGNFKNEIRKQKYDLVIDAQGLIKSALITRLALGQKIGLSSNSAREPLSSLVLDKRIDVTKELHAVERVRKLFSEALDYKIPDGNGDYGLSTDGFESPSNSENYLVFLHGTTWQSKHYPTKYWIDIAGHAIEAGYKVKIPWGNEAELLRAQEIANVTGAEVLSKLSLKDIASVLLNAKGVVSVDSGLGHLASAFDVPLVALYGATNSDLTGCYGRQQENLNVNFSCAPCMNKMCSLPQTNKGIQPPCYETLSPKTIWTALERKMQ